MNEPALQPPATLLECLPHEWEARMGEWGEPRYRALQVFRWIHQRGVLDPQAMSDLPKSLRGHLAEAGLGAPLALSSRARASDGTEKLLVELADGRRVETVLIPRGAVAPRDVYAPVPEDGEQAGQQLTQCISTQVGCAMGCRFCASGVAGLKRHLSAAEIIAQVLLSRSLLAAQERLSGIVLMGMGEPLHNYPAVARALCLLRHPQGVGMSLRRVTLSTSGLVPEIDRLAQDFGGQVQLAVSVHAPDSQTRLQLMPIERKYSLSELVQALRRYPLPGMRRITIEYTLIDGLNDSPDHARRLCRLLNGLRVKVNLIPMNPVPGAPFGAPAQAAVDHFQRVLRAAGVDTFVRQRKGDDIAAACGQLALHGESPKVQLRLQRTSDPARAAGSSSRPPAEPDPER